MTRRRTGSTNTLEISEHGVQASPWHFDTPIGKEIIIRRGHDGAPQAHVEYVQLAPTERQAKECRCVVL